MIASSNVAADVVKNFMLCLGPGSEEDSTGFRRWSYVL